MSIVVDSHLSCDQWDGIHANHPSADAVLCSGYGQTFWTLSATRYGLTQVKFFMKKTGSPDGQLEARLYISSGICGIDGIPDGIILASSTPVNVASLTSGGSWISFMFSSPYFCMLDDTCYVIVVVLTGCTTLPAEYPSIKGGISDHDGNGTYYRASAWHDTNWDYCFYVYGESCGSGIIPDDPRIDGLYLEHVLGWDERSSAVIAKKRVIGRCCATPAPEEAYISMPREIRIITRVGSDEKEEIEDLWNECRWLKLYDRGGEFIDYVWMEEPNFKWDSSLGCGGKPWIATLSLVCSST